MKIQDTIISIIFAPLIIIVAVVQLFVLLIRISIAMQRRLNAPAQLYHANNPSLAQERRGQIRSHTTSTEKSVPKAEAIDSKTEEVPIEDSKEEEMHLSESVNSVNEEKAANPEKSISAETSLETLVEKELSKRQSARKKALSNPIILKEMSLVDMVRYIQKHSGNYLDLSCYTWTDRRLTVLLPWITYHPSINHVNLGNLYNISQTSELLAHISPTGLDVLILELFKNKTLTCVTVGKNAHKNVIHGVGHAAANALSHPFIVQIGEEIYEGYKLIERRVITNAVTHHLDNEGHSSIQYLPPEVWLHVLDYLDLSTLTQFSLLSLAAQGLARNNGLWKFLCSRDFPFLSTWFHKLKEQNWKEHYKFLYRLQLNPKEEVKNISRFFSTINRKFPSIASTKLSVIYTEKNKNEVDWGKTCEQLNKNIGYRKYIKEFSPLVDVIEHDSLILAAYLLKSGVSASRCRLVLQKELIPELSNSTNKTYWNAVHFAALSGHPGILRLLLHFGAQKIIDAPLHRPPRLTPLGLSVLNGHNRNVQTLLENDASILCNEANESIVHIGCGRSALINGLERQSLVNSPERQKEASLHYSREFSPSPYPEALRMLVQHGTPLEVLTLDRKLPILLAGDKGQVMNAKFLLKYGARLPVGQQRPNLPYFFYNEEHDKTANYEYLPTYANEQIKSTSNHKLSDTLIQLQELKKHLDAPEDVEIPNHLLQLLSTAVFHACETNSIAFLKSLLVLVKGKNYTINIHDIRYKYKVNANICLTLNPLHLAALRGSFECLLMFILFTDCDVNMIASKEFPVSALYLAIRNKKPKVVNLLLEYGAIVPPLNRCIPNHPVFAAVDNDAIECLELMLQYDNITPNIYLLGADDTPLYRAAIIKGNLETVKVLLKHGAYANDIALDSVNDPKIKQILIEARSEKAEPIARRLDLGFGATGTQPYIPYTEEEEKVESSQASTPH